MTHLCHKVDAELMHLHDLKRLEINAIFAVAFRPFCGNSATVKYTKTVLGGQMHVQRASSSYLVEKKLVNADLLS